MKQPPPAPPGHEKPAQPGRIRAVVLAVLVHAAFFAVIVFGVSWQSRPTPPVQAEIWASLPPVKDAKQSPPPQPAKPEPPKPEPAKPEPAKPEPPPPPKAQPKPKPEPVKPDPQIALRAEREKREQLERLKVEEKRKTDEKKQVEDDRRKAEEKKKAEDERRKEDARKVEERKQQEAKKREEDLRRRDQEAQKAATEAARRSEVDRFISAIQTKIRARANVPDTVTGNPEVSVQIRVLPGGEVLDMQITKRSGNPAYDAAIERGIKSASPLPVPAADSELFPRFRELNLNIRHER